MLPAHAGVILTSPARNEEGLSAPRARGGDSPTLTLLCPDG